MKTLKSRMDAQVMADRLLDRMDIGEKVEGNTWVIERANTTGNPFDWEFTVSRSMSVEWKSHYAAPALPSTLG